MAKSLEAVIATKELPFRPVEAMLRTFAIHNRIHLYRQANLSPNQPSAGVVADFLPRRQTRQDGDVSGDTAVLALKP